MVKLSVNPVTGKLGRVHQSGRVSIASCFKRLPCTEFCPDAAQTYRLDVTGTPIVIDCVNCETYIPGSYVVSVYPGDVCTWRLTLPEGGCTGSDDTPWYWEMRIRGGVPGSNTLVVTAELWRTWPQGFLIGQWDLVVPDTTCRFTDLELNWRNQSGNSCGTQFVDVFVTAL